MTRQSQVWSIIGPTEPAHLLASPETRLEERAALWIEAAWDAVLDFSELAQDNAPNAAASAVQQRLEEFLDRANLLGSALAKLRAGRNAAVRQAVRAAYYALNPTSAALADATRASVYAFAPVGSAVRERSDRFIDSLEARAEEFAKAAGATFGLGGLALLAAGALYLFGPPKRWRR